MSSHITVYHNARIFTAAKSAPWAAAMAVQNGRVIAVGEAAQVRRAVPQAAHQRDLHGRFVMPGICDSHIHLYDTIHAALGVHLTDCCDRAEMLSRIGQKASESNDLWLWGQGWNESRWPVTEYPTARELESTIGPQRPAIFWRSDMHVAVTSPAALRLAGITDSTPDPPGGRIGRDAAGAPNGLLYDTAIPLVSRLIPPMEGALLETAIKRMSNRLHQLGITAIHDQRLQSGLDGPRMLAAYSNLRARAELNLRVHCNLAGAFLDHALALGLRSGFGDDWLRIGHVKYFIDGSLGSRTAWMLAPYTAGEPDGSTATAPKSYGLCVTQPDVLRHEFLRAMQGGLSISVHAIGDRANREVLDIFEEILPSVPPPTLPHRIEHVQIIASTDVDRLARLNLTASVQPVHALDDIEIATRYLGERRASAYPFLDLHRSGVRLAFGSDAPVANLNPFLGIHSAVQRLRPHDSTQTWHPEQGLDLATALRAYTAGPSESVAFDKSCGTLESGKWADFLILMEDPFRKLAANGTSAILADIAVEETVLAGETVHTAV